MSTTRERLRDAIEHQARLSEECGNLLLAIEMTLAAHRDQPYVNFDFESKQKELIQLQLDHQQIAHRMQKLLWTAKGLAFFAQLVDGGKEVPY